MANPYDAGVKPLQRAENAIYEIERNWGFMTEEEFNPVPLALQLLDGSSASRNYNEFMRYFHHLDDSLEDIVDEYYQGFNNSILSFGEIKDKLVETQDSVRSFQENIKQTSESLGQDKSALGQLYYKTIQCTEMIRVLDQIEELKKISTDIEELNNKKQYLESVQKLLDGLTTINSEEVRQIGALVDLREQLTKEKNMIHEVIIEELNNHIYLKSPYCERRMGIVLQDDEDDTVSQTKPTVKPAGMSDQEWQAKGPGGRRPQRGDKAIQNDDNPEADSFAYVEMLLKSLMLLDRIDDSVATIQERIPIELHHLADRIIAEVEERHKLGMPNAASKTELTPASTLNTKALMTPKQRAQAQEVLEDFVTTLYARFGSVLEYHKFVLEVINKSPRRQSQSTTSARSSRGTLSAYALREVWMTIQSEIKSMLYDYLTADTAVAHRSSDLTSVGSVVPSGGAAGSVVSPGPGARDRVSTPQRPAAGTLAKAAAGGSRWLDEFNLNMIRSKSTTGQQPQAAGSGLPSPGPAASAATATDMAGPPPRQLFSFSQSEIKTTSEALYKPIEDEVRQVLQMANYDQMAQMASNSTVVDRFADGCNTAGHQLLVSPSIYHASVVLSPTIQFLAKIGHVLLEPRDTQDFDEFLRDFFVRFFLPQVEAHALHLFQQITSGSDAFYNHPTLLYRGRPVVKSAVSIVPLIHDLAGMLSAIPFYREEYVTIIEKIIRQYFEECHRRFVEAIATSKMMTHADGSGGGTMFHSSLLHNPAGPSGGGPVEGGPGVGNGSNGMTMERSTSGGGVGSGGGGGQIPALLTKQCLSSQWARDEDLLQLLDMKLQLTLHDPNVQYDPRGEKETQLEFKLKHERSIHPSELMFDVKKLNFLATLHHSLEWFLLNVKYSKASRVYLGAAQAARKASVGNEGRMAVGVDGGVDKNHPDAGPDGGAVDDPSDPSAYHSLDLDVLAQMKGLRERLDELWDRHRVLATSCLVILRIEIRCRCMYFLELATREGNYGLSEESQEPDQYIQTFNADLIMCEELLAKSLPRDEIEFVFSGISHLISYILINNAGHLKDLNYFGSRKMVRNVLALQQNLTNISLSNESGLDHALKYYELFQLDLDTLMHHISTHELVFSIEEYRFLISFVYNHGARKIDIDSDQYELNYRKYREGLDALDRLFIEKQ
ncbi:exocyst subunit [Dimargaris cristalligena]|nr:exocyst subunit [Dimargaris cristalligena]